MRDASPKLSITRLHASAPIRSSRASCSLQTPLAIFVATVGDSPSFSARLTTTSCVRGAFGATRLDTLPLPSHLRFPSRLCLNTHVHTDIVCASDYHRHACSCRLIQKRCRQLARGRGRWPQASSQNGFGVWLFVCLLVRLCWCLFVFVLSSSLTRDAVRARGVNTVDTAQLNTTHWQKKQVEWLSSYGCSTEWSSQVLPPTNGLPPSLHHRVPIARPEPEVRQHLATVLLLSLGG